MRRAIANRRSFFLLGLVAWSVVLLVGATAALSIAAERSELIFPGARVASEGSLYSVFPRPYLRRDLSLRSDARFPAVYNWYSSRLSLGPESRAQSRCIHMESSTRWYLFHRYTGVTLCDTPSGQMMFVQRTIWIR